jgi:N-acetylneuraminic acid mutarotase
MAKLLIRLVPVFAVCALPAHGQTLWRNAESLNQPRLQTPGTLLKDGRVLLVGSLTCSPGCYSYPTAEIYDPAASTWTLTAPLNTPRFNHAIALLQSGKVLVAGGYLNPGVLTPASEIFDPGSGNWTPTGSLITPRQFHQGVALADGRVLVTGGLGMDGNGGFATLSSAEIYNPSTGSWSPAGSMSTPRYEHTLTALADGRILAVGGYASSAASATPLAAADVYDPVNNVWAPASPVTIGLAGHTATLLANGEVLVVGGYAGSSGTPTRGAELYAPSSDQWTSAAMMRVPRADHTATLLPGGSVLVVAGRANWVTTEIYNPVDAAWSPAPELNTGRSLHSATLLNDGRVLVAGGADINDVYLTSAELLDEGASDRRGGIR